MAVSKLIQDFHTEEAHKYGLTIEQTKEVCEAPFLMLKTIMGSNVFKNVRFKYFGLFTVSKRKIKYTIKNLQKQIESGKITEEYYKKRLKTLQQFIDEDND